LSKSPITGLYRLGVAERIDELLRLDCLSAADAELLRQGKHTLSVAKADKMIENVVGVFGLPFAIAPNFIVNEHEYIVPMVVEEPSIVAATSNAAKLARPTGGFVAQSSESLQIGQIHISGVGDCEAALGNIAAADDELLALCNAVHPRLTERGGGVRSLEARILQMPDDSSVVTVHLLVDTCDAMGANLVNTLCEAVAPRVAELCGGDVALRILSNLTDRALVRCRVRYRCDDLRSRGFDGETVRDGIVLASNIASADPYRAATHNKGIMNGVDAVAIATGNDWRAIEAGAHAYAAMSGQYLPLATWTVADNGDLAGELRMPLKPGIVGANLDSNAGASFGLRVAGANSATELAELMAAVGLAQNFAALRALATSGIQRGHMKLHARSVASSAAVPDEWFDDVVDELVASGDIKVSTASRILQQKRHGEDHKDVAGTAAGKVILLGEHAVVYGKHALALPVKAAVSAAVLADQPKPVISIPDWNLEQPIAAPDETGVNAAVTLIQRELGIEAASCSLYIRSRLPRAMGLGSSAAIAVAITRAFGDAFDLGLDDARVNAIAFECEKLAHGTPSGIDNTVATYGEPMVFRNTESLQMDSVQLTEPPPIVIACSSKSGLTKEQVAGVRARRARSGEHYAAIFDEVDALTLSGADALARADYDELGLLMNICHGLLGAIEVSTSELENMVSIARAAGAVGAKITGSGGGGSIVALCPGVTAEVSAALAAAGYKNIILE
jgi:hydroxymethylglutaryl-CoA reductase